MPQYGEGWPFPVPLVAPAIRCPFPELDAWVKLRKPFSRRLNYNDREVYQKARSARNSRPSYKNSVEDPETGDQKRAEYAERSQQHRPEKGTEKWFKRSKQNREGHRRRRGLNVSSDNESEEAPANIENRGRRSSRRRVGSDNQLPSTSGELPDQKRRRKVKLPAPHISDTSDEEDNVRQMRSKGVREGDSTQHPSRPTPSNRAESPPSSSSDSDFEPDKHKAKRIKVNMRKVTRANGSRNKQKEGNTPDPPFPHKSPFFRPQNSKAQSPGTEEDVTEGNLSPALLQSSDVPAVFRITQMGNTPSVIWEKEATPSSSTRSCANSAQSNV